MIKTKYLLQALKFACLPTLSVLVLLFFGFFSFTKVIDFITSDCGLAVALRIVLIIAELILVYIMYKYYEKEGLLAGEFQKTSRGTHASSSTRVEDLQSSWSYRDNYRMHKIDYNTVVIERIDDN